MPPKKKGKAGPVIDGVDTTQMTREQLEVFCLRVKEENEREREERNFFQMERDKLRTFWEITRNELEEARAKLRNKDRQIEEAAEKNADELKFYKQKVKHLQFEQQNNMTDYKAQALVSLKNAQEEHTQQERELLKDKKDLKARMREQEVAHQDQIKAMKLQHQEELHNAAKDFDTKAKELEMKFEKKFSELKEELNTKHDMEIAETEERKNKQITALTVHSEKTFEEMKNYYNDITLNNLALISSLKDQMEVLRKQNERLTKQAADLTAENRRLEAPLQRALDEVAEFKRQLQNYEKDKVCLANTKAKLKETTRQLEDLRWANDALELRFDALKVERDELHERFVNAVLEVQQKTGVKNVLLQKRIQALNQVTEHNEALISTLTAKLGLTAVADSNKHLANMLGQKNTAIADLQYELARVCKAHDDLLNTFHDTLRQHGIPAQDLGFIPLRVLPKGQAGIATGPAGLVTTNR